MRSKEMGFINKDMRDLVRQMKTDRVVVKFPMDYEAMEDINDSIVEELIEEIHAQKLITWDDEINTDKLEMWLKDMYRLENK